jgi:hypothetical protein
MRLAVDFHNQTAHWWISSMTLSCASCSDEKHNAWLLNGKPRQSPERCIQPALYRAHGHGCTLCIKASQVMAAQAMSVLQSTQSRSCCKVGLALSFRGPQFLNRNFGISIRWRARASSSPIRWFTAGLRMRSRHGELPLMPRVDEDHTTVCSLRVHKSELM